MEVTVTTTSKATLSNSEVYRICAKQILDAAGWTEGNYISDGRLMLEVEYRSTHTWNEYLYVRDATALDFSVETLLNRLRNKLLV